MDLLTLSFILANGPARPVSWLIRSAPFLIHYAYDQAVDQVVLLNLFRRR